VLEPLSGYLLPAERLWDDGPSFSGAWNFAPAAEDAWPVERVAARLQELWGAPIPIEQAGGSFPETDYLRLDASRAHRLLGWTPSWDLERVAEWYGAFRDGRDMRELTLAQIRSHPAAASDPAPAAA
jgi:CDP-glucose 4,6-dehydratase